MEKSKEELAKELFDRLIKIDIFFNFSGDEKKEAIKIIEEYL